MRHIAFALVATVLLCSSAVATAQQVAAGVGVPLAGHVSFSEPFPFPNGGFSTHEYDLTFAGSAACCRQVSLNTVDCRVFKGLFKVEMTGESVFSDSIILRTATINSGTITGI
jgi:hypothetical protein